MEITPDILIAIEKNLTWIEEHEGNIAYWQIALGALRQEKDDLKPKEYNRFLRMIDHRIRRNEKRIKELQRRVTSLQRKYKQIMRTDEEPWLTRNTTTSSTTPSINESQSRSSSTERNL